MRLRYFMDDSVIPNDGSKHIIESYRENTSDDSLEILIYPDVHYKKGAKVVNGMLTSSMNSIFPSMLGVANCGFTFGKIDNVTIEERELLKKTFSEYSKSLKAYNTTKNYTNDYIISKYEEFSKRILLEKYNYLLEHLGINSEQELYQKIERIISDNLLDLSSRQLGTLGGGNHFFELHFIEEVLDDSFGLQKGDIIYILHTDSIGVGEKINLLFSNLSELAHIKGVRGLVTRGMNRMRQFNFFAAKTGLLLKEPIGVLQLLLSQNPYRRVKADSKLGKTLLFAFFVAGVFGDINRDEILEGYQNTAKQIISNIKLIKLGSHSHDSINLEQNYNQIRVVQRNGVQRIGDDHVYVLPGALGTVSYLMKNTFNQESYYSANHGVGRVLDKHLSKEAFTASGTEDELKKRNLELFRVGNGDIAEQHPYAFKSIQSVIDVMEENNLGKRIAKIIPFVSMKG